MIFGINTWNNEKAKIKVEDLIKAMEDNTELKLYGNVRANANPRQILLNNPIIRQYVKKRNPELFI